MLFNQGVLRPGQATLRERAAAAAATSSNEPQYNTEPSPPQQQQHPEPAIQQAASFRRQPPPPPPPRSSNNTSFVIALYDLDAQQEGDLSIRKDDKIEVLERTQDTMDWWKGRIGDRVGMFPGKIQLMGTHFLDGMIHSTHIHQPPLPLQAITFKKYSTTSLPPHLLFLPNGIKRNHRFDLCFSVAIANNSSNSPLRSHNCRKMPSCRVVVVRRLYGVSNSLTRP